MRILWILAGCFGVMLLLPLAFAALYYRVKKGDVLRIHQDKIRDPRYFGKSFAAMVENSLDAVGDGVIRLSRMEPFLDGNAMAERGERIEALVIARKGDFYPPETVQIFEKEIYCAENAFLLHPETELRAIYCGKKGIIGNGITVYRWADAGDTLSVYDGCDLGISASAANALCVGYNCTFRRLYAPEIRIAQRPEWKKTHPIHTDQRIHFLRVQNNREFNVRYITDDRVDENGIANYSIISPHKVTVPEGLVVQGDIRSHRGVRLCDGAAVCGNIFAEENIWLGRNVTVLGNVLSQGSVRFEEGAGVGRGGKISSVVARESIIFEGNNFVFGYVCCERGGKTLSPPESPPEEGQSVEYCTLDTPQRLRCLSFASVRDFQNVDIYGYRTETELEEVLFPKETEKIPGSMFFACPALREAVLPETVTEIGDYAFADCVSLEKIGEISRLPLRKIGIAAFENCKLSEVSFPESLQYIAGAAFSGCTALRQVRFPDTCAVRFLGDHCFRGCAFQEIWLPDTVEKVGVSAFRDCKALRRVSVPETCGREPGIRELAEFGVEVELRSMPAPERQTDDRRPAEIGR